MYVSSEGLTGGEFPSQVYTCDCFYASTGNQAFELGASVFGWLLKTFPYSFPMGSSQDDSWLSSEQANQRKCPRYQERWSSRSFWKLILKLASHYLCCILFATIELLNLAHNEEQEFIQRYEYIRKWGLLGIKHIHL
jgi:hypothetical protein